MDIQAFRNYYDTYYEQLCCFLNFYTHDVAVIEDVIQEVFLKLWENKDCIEITYIKTYLFRKLFNCPIHHFCQGINVKTIFIFPFFQLLVKPIL